MSPLAAIGLWVLLLMPGVPYLVFLRNYRRGRDQNNGEEPPLDAASLGVVGVVGHCLVALSSYWLFVALLFSPWILFYLAGSGGSLSAYLGFLTGCAGAIGLILWFVNKK